MRYNMVGAPQAKNLWSAPSKSRFYYLFWLLELMPGHLRRSILRILVLNPTHEISWSRSGFFSLRGRILRAGPRAPLCFLVFVFSPPPSALEAPGRPLTERSKTLRPARRATLSGPIPSANTAASLRESGLASARRVVNGVFGNGTARRAPRIPPYPNGDLTAAGWSIYPHTAVPQLAVSHSYPI